MNAHDSHAGSRFMLAFCGACGIGAGLGFVVAVCAFFFFFFLLKAVG